VIDAPLDIADRARALSIRMLGPFARPLLVPREARVAFYGLPLLATALAMSSLFPAWVVGFGPIVWGVPHVLSDIRYLVVRRGYHKRWLLVVPALASLALSYPFGLRAALPGAAAVAVLSRGAAWRKIAVLGALGGLGWLAFQYTRAADLTFVHAHNAVGFLLFFGWRKRAGAWHWAIGAAAAAGALAIAFGLLDNAALSLPSPRGFVLEDVAFSVSPVYEGAWPMRFLLLYAFGQTAHYVVWMRLVPEEDRETGPRSFRQSLRALRKDLGIWILGASLLTMIGLAIWAAYDVAEARLRYLHLAFFHGYLELIVGALWLTEGRGAAVIAARTSDLSRSRRPASP
jgi:hypothetical protein